MATKKKQVAQMAQEPVDSLAEIVEQPIVENNEHETVVEEPVKEEMPKFYIPDIPAQMLEEEVPEESDEIQFLRRILNIQNDGGFGRHLDRLILDRIKSLS